MTSDDGDHGGELIMEYTPEIAQAEWDARHALETLYTNPLDTEANWEQLAETVRELQSAIDQRNGLLAIEATS